MAAPDVNEILRVPGRLSFGGTQIGITREMRYEPQPILREIFAEEFGVNTDVIYCGERPMFYGTLRYMDSDAIATLFNPTGATYEFDVNSSVRAGTSLDGNAGVLLFTPLDDTNAPRVRFYNAIPAIAKDAFLRFSWGVEFGLKIAFYATPNSDGQVYKVGQGV